MNKKDKSRNQKINRVECLLLHNKNIKKYLKIIRLLEQAVRDIRTENSVRFDDLQRLVNEERDARIRAETELELLKRNQLHR